MRFAWNTAPDQGLLSLSRLPAEGPLSKFRGRGSRESEPRTCKIGSNPYFIYFSSLVFKFNLYYSYSIQNILELILEL
jgi:hypothetical protein